MKWLRLWGLFIYQANKFFDPKYDNSYYLDNKKKFSDTIFSMLLVSLFSFVSLCISMEFSELLNVKLLIWPLVLVYILYLSILFHRIMKQNNPYLFFVYIVIIALGSLFLMEHNLSWFKNIGQFFKISSYHIAIITLALLESVWLFVKYLLPLIAKIILTIVSPLLSFCNKIVLKINSESGGKKNQDIIKPISKDFKITGHKSNEERKLEDLL